MILYLHGFLSTPASNKAQLLRSALAACGKAADFVCPQLPVSPRAAADVILGAAELESPDCLSVVGSSLGGFYATWLAERIGCRAALLNPAIRPFDDLAGQLGMRTEYGSGRIVEVRAEYLDELRALDTPTLTRLERYYLLAATGDEVIDYRTMAAKYAGCRQHVICGSDHSLPEFADYLPELLEFCGLTPTTASNRARTC